MADIARWFGGLFPTFMLTFFLMWLLGKLTASKVAGWLIANALSLGISTVLGGYGLAGWGSPNFTAAFIGYFPPQLVWLVVSGIIVKGRTKRQVS